MKSTYAEVLGCHLTLVAAVEAVDARILVIAVEDANAGEERERAGRHGARRQQVRPCRPATEGRRQEVALLLDAVGRDRSHLAQHVLASVVDAGAAAHDGLAVLRHVPGGAERGWNWFHWLGILPSDGNRGSLRNGAKAVVDGSTVSGIVCASHRRAVVERETVPGLPAVLHEERDLVVVDVGGASLVARDAVGAAALQVEEQRAAGRGRACRTAVGRVTKLPSEQPAAFGPNPPGPAGDE